MYRDLISIVIPVKEKPEIVSKFILENLDILSTYTVIVIDSGGGEEFTKFASIYYLHTKVSMIEARKIGYHFVDTLYILNLDVDNVLPKNYIEQALKLLEDKEVVMVAIDYERLLGHYGFGTSLWKADVLKKLYDYTGFKETRRCECLYMIDKLRNAGYKLETLPFRAKHIGKE